MFTPNFSIRQIMVQNGYMSRLDARHRGLSQVSFPMPRLRSFVKYWLPVLVWMAVIYSASSDTKSFEHSSRILAPILRWLMPQLSEEAVSHIVFIIRKCAHLTEYAILALLLCRSLRKPMRQHAR